MVTNTPTATNLFDKHPDRTLTRLETPLGRTLGGLWSYDQLVRVVPFDFMLKFVGPVWSESESLSC